MAEAKTVGSLHSDSTEVGFNSALGACQVAHLWEEALGSSAGTEEAMNRRMRRFLKGSWKPTVRGYFKLFPLIFRSICGLVEGQFHWKSFLRKKTLVDFLQIFQGSASVVFRGFREHHLTDGCW